MNFVQTLNNEIETYELLLQSIPFTDYPTTINYLKIYKLNYKELHKYMSSNSFPIDNSKLLKLTISLGNLIKSLHLDEEMYRNQQKNGMASKLNALAESPKHYINSVPINSQPLYQIKFIKNLLLILKNFDIGYHLKDQASSTTLNQYTSSPIKLNSKQLLIEKLEININLDTLFIYKHLLNLLVRIFDILKIHLGFNDNYLINSNDRSSIFSSNSVNSGSSDSISVDEYFRVLNQILNRVTNGLVEPLLKFIMDFVGQSVSSEFGTLITSL
ncbi:hypothetical protein CLIB1444_12S00650 [[Candida] jaroonii]|uniref:Uncharacterized protein n=1 Tax=[Candida] jaroonii TaxID=467808 RepID=A0ACA9YD12_9ASCO|nr:hypothetical protein CLIB1444_12S00650 [[Candida] jaroonii]